MFISFIRFDQREVVRDVRVKLRQLQRDRLRFLLPLRPRLRRNFIDLVRRIYKVGLFIVRLVGADIPDTGIFRRHHVQSRSDFLRIVTVGNVHRIQRMGDGHADHGIRQPFHIPHIPGDGRVTKI